MKIDELIEELEQVRREHGNLEVGIQTLRYGIKKIDQVENTFASLSLRKEEFNIADDEKAEIVRLRNSELDHELEKIIGTKTD